MELTRREAVAALTAIGAGGATLVYSHENETADGDEQVRETMVAIAEVVYPSELSGIEPFVTTYLEGRLDDENRRKGVQEAVARLDQHAETWEGNRIRALEPDVREEVLRDIGADTADENPDGNPAERVRYYVVNELLLALYASPKGAELVGLENPQGHPGGTDSYQRGPQP